MKWRHMHAIARYCPQKSLQKMNEGDMYTTVGYRNQVNVDSLRYRRSPFLVAVINVP